MLFTLKKIAADDYRTLLSVGESLRFLRKEYPNFNNWYNHKVIKGVSDQTRKIFVACLNDESERFGGVMILKNTVEQKKICTLCVFDDYKGQQIGTEFIKKAFEELGTKKPLITVSENNKTQFDAIFKKFGFELTQEYPSYYRENITEYSYNNPIELLKLGEVSNG